MTTNFDILDKAEKLELLASEIYAAFARRFGDDPAALQLFTLLGDEERCSRAHAQGLLGLNDSLRKFFEALALQDKAHAELLKS